MTPNNRAALPQPVQPRAGRIRITADHWDELHGHLLGDDGHEHAALLICGTNDQGAVTELLVREVLKLGPADYVDAGEMHLAIAPATLARHAKHARVEHATLVLCHSHPFPGPVLASPVDLRTEIDLCGRVFGDRLNGLACAALVVGPDGLDGRVWRRDGASPLTDVTVIGPVIVRHPVHSHGLDSLTGLSQAIPPVSDPNEPTSRQALLWGTSGQARLHNAHVAVIGCGGTGSHVIAQLAHLRVGALTLIDPDMVETSNLSRLLSAAPADVGRAKVNVLADHVRRINPDIKVSAVGMSVLDVNPQTLLGADVIVCATDGHGSRALLTEIVHQYLRPVVDLGVEVDPAAESFRAGGGVRNLRPGRGCLHCARTLSPALVREEYLDAAQQRFEAERGYLRGVPEPAPSVVALNGVVASLAVLEVCQLLVGMLGGSRDRILYRAEARAMSTAALPQDPACFVCGCDGLLGLGDGRALPMRSCRADQAS